jgi:hypothetical protein
MSTVDGASTRNITSQTKQVSNLVTRQKGPVSVTEAAKYTVCPPFIDLTFNDDLTRIQVMERAHVVNDRSCSLVASTLEMLTRFPET